MIIYANITNFTYWFIDEVIAIWTDMISKLNRIDLVNNVSLLEFIIAIILLGIFIPILVNAPNKIKIKEKRRKNDK